MAKGGKSGRESLVKIDGQGARLGGRPTGRAGRQENRVLLRRFLQLVHMGKGEEARLEVKSKVLEVKSLMTVRSRVS